MKNQKGFTIVELLIVVAIVCVLALIADISYRRARVSGVTEPFKKHFGISLEEIARKKAFESSTEWLDSEQKERLRPIVAARLQTLCLEATQLEGPSECQSAREAARHLGLQPQ